MTSLQSIRGLATSLLVLATLFVLAITTTRHQHTINEINEPTIEQSTHHTFHTKQVNDVTNDLYVISRPESHRWMQVNDTSATSESLDPDALHTFHWIFPSRNVDWVHTQLTAVSDPNSARYGGWLSKADVDAMTQPEHSIKQPVISWLIDNGLTDDDWLNLGTMLTITAPISLIESMFHTQMKAYALPMRNVSDSDELDLSTMVIRTDGSISIPLSLNASMAHITGLIDFPAVSELARFNHTAMIQAVESGRRRRFKLHQATTPLPCSDDVLYTTSIYVTPSLLARAYNYPSRQTDVTPQSSTRYPAIITGLTTTDTVSECFTSSDLMSVPSLLGFSSTPRLASGSAVCEGSETPTDQASSDIATLYSVVPTTQIGSFYTPTNGDIAAIANMILAMSDANIPSVVAYSYSSYADTNPSVRAADAALAQLALRGVTFVVSSGVQGAPGPANSFCESDPNLPSGSQGSATLTAAYPASSPYVLSVGATDFLFGVSPQNAPSYVGAPGQSGLPPACNMCSNGGPNSQLQCMYNLAQEQPVTPFQFPGAGFSTGGGFANYDSGANLEWQRAAKERYTNVECTIANLCELPDSRLYSSSRRGFPDVAAYGSFSPYAIDGQLSTQNILPTIITSAAALWAGYIARMNEVSSTPMGYVNPYLYTMAQRDPTTFNDITVGNNIVPQDYYWSENPDNEFSTPCAGYAAAPGWDPLTGLGSPNLGRILDYVRANPNTPPVVVGDPTITGFHGHTMQVHGTSGEYYNLISTPNFQYNAQFVFLSEGACTAELKNRTECWSHAGTYLGELGLLIGGAAQPVVRVHVQAGSINEGLTVTVYDEQSETPSLMIEPSIDDTFTHSRFTLTQPNPFTAVLTMDEFVITWHNSDQFVNQQVSMQTKLDLKIESFITQQQQHFQSIQQPIKRSQVSPDHDATRQLPHGLLGQSWSERSYDNQWKWLQGRVDDYVVTDGLFGTQFLYNRFVDQTQ